MYLNFKQRRYLRKTKKGITYTTPTYDPLIDYLYENKLVSITEYPGTDDYMLQIKITEKGKSYLSEYASTTGRANLAFLVSVISLLISALTYLFK